MIRYCIKNEVLGIEVLANYKFDLAKRTLDNVLITSLIKTNTSIYTKFIIKQSIILNLLFEKIELQK